MDAYAAAGIFYQWPLRAWIRNAGPQRLPAPDAVFQQVVRSGWCDRDQSRSPPTAVQRRLRVIAESLLKRNPSGNRSRLRCRRRLRWALRRSCRPLSNIGCFNTEIALRSGAQLPQFISKATTGLNEDKRAPDAGPGSSLAIWNRRNHGGTVLFSRPGCLAQPGPRVGLPSTLRCSGSMCCRIAIECGRAAGSAAAQARVRFAVRAGWPPVPGPLEGAATGPRAAITFASRRLAGRGGGRNWPFISTVSMHRIGVKGVLCF